MKNFVKNPSCEYGKHLCDNGKCEYKLVKGNVL